MGVLGVKRGLLLDPDRGVLTSFFRLVPLAVVVGVDNFFAVDGGLAFSSVAVVLAGFAAAALAFFSDGLGCLAVAAAAAAALRFRLGGIVT